MNDGIHFRTALNSTEPLFQAEEEIRPQSYTSFFIPSVGLLNIAFRFRPDEKIFHHLSAFSFFFTSSQDAPSTGETLQASIRRSSSLR